MKIRRLAAEEARNATQVAEIRKSIVSLKDEDLLDLADIFSGEIPTFLGDAAQAELTRRNLSLESHLAN